MVKKGSERVPIDGEWDRLEEALAEGTVRGKSPSAALQQELEGFDEAELAVLRRLATRARLSRSRAAPLGTVFFLPGIAGSDLDTVAGNDRDHIWINFLRLIWGRMERLKLAPDGAREADDKYRVAATKLNKRYYARAILSLRARWNVEPFPYDWRKDIDTATDDLARSIRAQVPGRPVHFVAHSMGGLVARNLVRRHAQLWESMRDQENATGGRLVMLGTPNYGSFAIVQVMTGEDEVIALLEKCDVPHDMPQLLAITNTFPGTYQLLPAPSKLTPTLSALYQADTWPKSASVSQRHLNTAFAFHSALDSGSTVDPGRMVYVAGCRRPTIVDMKVAGRGDFEYVLSYDGDGRVPHALGLLPGVPTYYVDEIHGDLARNEDVLSALDDILESGSTRALGTTALRGLDRSTPSMREYRTATDRELMNEVDRIAQLAHRTGVRVKPSLSELRVAEDALIRAALGSGRSPRPASSSPAAEVPRQVSLRVAPVLADVCDVRAPAVVVGHYPGVAPVNAIGAIDKRLGGWLTLANERGMVGGRLGETFIVPTKGGIEAEMVVVAGMGAQGTFTEEALQILMTNVALGAGALGLKSFATVLIGAGEGNLEPDRVLRALVNGVVTGLQALADRSSTPPRLKNVLVVEHNPDRFLALIDDLEALKSDERLRTRLEIRVPEASEIRRARRLRSSQRGRPRHASSARSSSDGDEVRLTLESPDGGQGAFRFSALTRSAVVPVRDVEVNPRVFPGLGLALQKATPRAEQEQYGRLLFDYLMPEDFDEVIGDSRLLRLIVDRSTASFPWEMACFRSATGAGGVRWLGLELGLTRQFRTVLSRPPGETPPLNDRARVLVIADPAPERELQLPFARREGRMVVEALRRLNKPGLRIEVESRIGANECDLVEILALLLTGGFDVVHFAGHGDYDSASPEAAGWVFSRDQILTARDIFRARRVPRLVFANACFSGVIHAGEAHGVQELSRGLATVAQAFFERGVPNYIGSGWPISDEQAATFAVEFYERAFQRETLGTSVGAAREKIFGEAVGSTWGAYQHYGDPNDRLVREP